MTETDVRECARADRCAHAWTDETGARRGAWGPRALCDTDRRILADTIRDLPRLYAHLWLMLGDHPTGPRPYTTAHPTTAPLPLNLGVDALMRGVYDMVASWEERVRDVARLPARDTAGPHPRPRLLADAARTLAAHVDVLLALQPAPMVRRYDRADQVPDGAVIIQTGDGHTVAVQDLDGAAAARELFAAAARCRSRIGLTVRTEMLPGVACPTCGMVAVVRRSGEDPHCAACHTVLTDLVDTLGRNC